MAIDSKRIAKNTIFMYVRMILIMGVTLYTSRVVLDKLGVDDYALYNVIFSLIGILSFLNGTLSIGTSRFLTFELGANNFERLKKTFSTAVFAHLSLAIIILIIGETLGVWYFNNVMVVAPSKLLAAKIVYQISIISTCTTILQVPYTSSIIAHEKMGIYAYIGIFEAVGKLAIVYILTVTSSEKLVTYAVLTMIIHFMVAVIYVCFCLRLFPETRSLTKPNTTIFKNILNFSGWNILANISNTLLTEGVILLFNIFFQPFVVAAQGIAKQISSAIMSFVSNIRVAVNPQITKLFANGSYAESRQLTLTSAELIFYLLLIIGVPCIVVMPKLLEIWLVDFPEYAIEFARLIVLQNILDNFNSAFYTPMTAANKIKLNSIASVLICFVQFILLYILFKFGATPIWARYISILSCVIFSFIVKPYILYKYIDYSIRELSTCIIQCLKVGLVVALCTTILSIYLSYSTLLEMLSTIVIIDIVIVVLITLLCSKEVRSILLVLLKKQRVQ